MTDKSWLLNPSAIAAAKKCINAIEQELGVKLKLSHPQFLSMIEEYTELTDSESIAQAKEELLVFANLGQKTTVKKTIAEKIVKLNNDIVNPIIEPPPAEKPQTETVSFKGRDYPRFDDQGNEFQGLYRGQARYA